MGTSWIKEERILKMALNMKPKVKSPKGSLWSRWEPQVRKDFTKNEGKWWGNLGKTKIDGEAWLLHNPYKVEKSKEQQQKQQQQQQE